MCGKQIVTENGKSYVTMQSGRTVHLHRCILKPGHMSPCGWMSRPSREASVPGR